MFARRFTFVASALMFLPGCGSDSTRATRPEDAGASPPKLDFTEYDTAISAFLADHGIKGASGVVVHKDYGQMHVQGYGEYAADRLYLVASSSKVVSVGVLMRLADEGKLDIDAPIGQYLSTWGAGGKPDLEVA